MKLRDLTYTGRHRAPATRPVPPSTIVADGLMACLRHLADGRTEDEAWDLASIDAGDMRAAQKAVAR